MRQGQGFDKTSLENYLTNSVSVFKGPIAEVLQFKGGQSNPTFYFKDSAGREYVLRKKPYGKLLPSAVSIGIYNPTSSRLFYFNSMKRCPEILRALIISVHCIILRVFF